HFRQSATNSVCKTLTFLKGKFFLTANNVLDIIVPYIRRYQGCSLFMYTIQLIQNPFPAIALVRYISLQNSQRGRFANGMVAIDITEQRRGVCESPAGKRATHVDLRVTATENPT